MTAGLAGAVATLCEASTASFLFEDTSIAVEDTADFFVGDVVAGEVEIDLSTGDYKVTWTADLAMPFRGPLRFELFLANGTLGSVVLLAADYAATDVLPAYSYNGNLPELMAWRDGDSISTHGPGFTSAVISTSPMTIPGMGVDFVQFTGTLSVDDEIVEEPPMDSDGDGVPDVSDPFPDSDTSPTVVLFGVDTGITNAITDLPVGESGASLTDIILALEAVAAAETRTHGQYVGRFSWELRQLVEDGWLSARQRALLISIVAGGHR